MSSRKSDDKAAVQADYTGRVLPLVPQSPWVLRVTEHKDKPVPVLVVKERVRVWSGGQDGASATHHYVLKERGLIYGQPFRRILPVVREILVKVCDASGIPLELHRYLGNGRIWFRGNLPLDSEAGEKLALIFKLQERVSDMDRVELIAWRVERFTREEAAYWLTRATQFGEGPNRWALAGMRIMLGGQPGDKGIQAMLQQLRR
ncbi:DUF7680 family protein [Kyrpidia tusciae]|uniref:DUF7680 domain-containing protein n=1 Tax=Kyrpidia tusciae (strain DSM 2912 / NBRC 15312 / T2) TaxID=562970 RepID=D5WV22_KYRT2|nr:hypothetical protein [Kyrpidia tusciae]ADG07494.1 hypothetical protein Btus_2856 [Kyrpidia tusciae DSM 2912]